MQCPFCYAWIAEDAEVCPRCERRLSPSAGEASALSAARGRADRVLAESFAPTEDGETVASGRAAWLPVAGLVSILVVALGLIVWLSWPREAAEKRVPAVASEASSGRPPATISRLPARPQAAGAPAGGGADRLPAPEPVDAAYETVLPSEALDPAVYDAGAVEPATRAEDLARLRFQQFRLEESHRESQSSLRRLYDEAEDRHASDLAELERRATEASRAYEARIAELRAEQERMARTYGQSLAEVGERQTALQARQGREAEDLQKRIASEKAMREAMESEWERERAALLASQSELEREYEGQLDQLRRRQARLESRLRETEPEEDDD